jgi:citrate/tricarballylate utilization protein
MLPDELVRRGHHVMTVCNACRYCEAYCPVFPAMENRLTFAAKDLTYLANLCHNCGECLYACQFAPPHEFGINVPRTLAEFRTASYEDYCWPRFLGRAFEQRRLLTTVSLALGFVVVLVAAGARAGTTGLDADFYRVIPHDTLVTIFGAAALFVITALVVGVARFRRDLQLPRHIGVASLGAVRDALTLRHLHSTGIDCTEAQDARHPWRRWLHHGTFYGFALCFASTSVAALYHLAGWRAPYPYTSVPVVLGSFGGVGLLVGPLGLWLLRRQRDPALQDPKHAGLDTTFSLLVAATSATGLLLLALRESAAMEALLILHLAIVLALFLTLPYGKFVHGLYRLAALVKFSSEASRSSST